ncbi:UDP-N-acetylmuramoyl-tripeptide--D-alanyl-D-alanine ligase [Ruminococcus champanellensis]|uniref:UDP-N-acetylmuramoyl-tripeptide--D-alanyl-D- alanine ligase n=1 Tax=Ruminococcus champanellensis TaxID=1161942 RepID=UPI003AB7BA55
MEQVTLTEIAQAVGGTLSNCPDCAVTEISTDTRTITPGCVFLALRGARFDGHTFAKQACEQGAVAVISDHVIPDCPCIVVDSTGKALLAFAAYYRRKFQPFFVGVTGSVGKTTTKNMIALVLSAHCKTLKTAGNLNNEIGLPKTLMGLDSTYKAAVVEMGMSDFGEISRLSKAAAPSIGVITNIGFSHIAQLKSQEGICRAKLEILDGMAADAPLVVNGDDPYLIPLKTTLSRPVYTYGIKNAGADCRAERIVSENGCTSFDLCWQGTVTPVTLPCIGEHNVMNGAAAFCIGMLAGMEPEEIAGALRTYQPDGMRQNIQQIDDKTVILDCYNASPDSMRASLSVLGQLSVTGRRIGVLGDMLELGEQSRQLHRMVGGLVTPAQVDLLFCYGPESRYIAEEAAKQGVPVQYFTEKEALTEQLRRSLQPGDAVLFKASRGMQLESVAQALFPALAV